MSQLTQALKSPSKQKGNVKNTLVTILIWAILLFVSFLTLFPYVWMVLTSFKDRLETMSMEFTVFPKVFKLDSYFALGDQSPSFFRAMLNTLLIEVSVIPIGTFVTALAAFAFAKMRLPHKHFWLLFLMSGMMVPYAALMLPQYRVFSSLEWVGTPLPLIIPGLFGNVSMKFFFIQYMKSTPTALIEAGRVDGASWFTIFLKLFCQQSSPQLRHRWYFGFWAFGTTTLLRPSTWAVRNGSHCNRCLL